MMMTPAMAPSSSSSSSSSVTVRVDKATSEFLIGPDWTLNMEICDTVNSNQMWSKDVVKAVKKRLQHKNPKVQLLALTLLETMVKNCGDYVHFQIAERNILQEMVKIVRKKTDMHVRDKILTLIGSWHEAFGGHGGKYPQYYMAYEDLRRSGVRFPQRSPDAVPIFTPPAAHPIPRYPQPGYGMPGSSSTRLDEAMASEDNLSLSNMESMQNVLDLFADMLQAVNPNYREALKDEVIIDLVEQCRVNQRKLMQSLATIGDEELLGRGLELNDRLQSVLAKHDAIASGSPLPRETTNITQRTSEEQDSSPKSAEVSTPNESSSSAPAAPVFAAEKSVHDEEDEEEDDFAQLARRHSKTPADVSSNTSAGESNLHLGGPQSPSMSNALVPINSSAESVQTKDQDIIELLSITLSTAASTDQTSNDPTSPMHTSTQVPSTSAGVPFSFEAPYPGNSSAPFNSYVAPWAQPQPQPQTAPQYQPEYALNPQPRPGSYYQPNSAAPQPRPGYYYQPNAAEPQPQYVPPSQPLYQNAPRAQTQTGSGYPPPPWAATPGYYSNQSSASRPLYTNQTPRPNSGEMRDAQNSNSRPVNAGQKPFIPSYRLFEDLDVFSNTDRRFKTTSSAAPSLLGSNTQNMVGGRK